MKDELATLKIEYRRSGYDYQGERKVDSITAQFEGPDYSKALKEGIKMLRHLAGEKDE